MCANTSSPFLVKSASGKKRRHKHTFQTGESIPGSGIYRVVHKAHRLPYDVTLLRNETFPRCAKCKNAVKFQLIKAATGMLNERGFCVRLYELPEEDDSGAIAV